MRWLLNNKGVRHFLPLFIFTYAIREGMTTNIHQIFVVQTHMSMRRIKPKHSVIEMHQTIAEMRYFPNPKQKFDEVASVISAG